MDRIRGVTFGPFAPRGSFDAPAAAESLRRMAESTGAGWVVFAPAGIQQTPQSESIDFSGPGALSDGELAGMIQLARDLGLQVALKPTVNCANGVWRAHIHFLDPDVPCEPKWSNWFASHEAFQLHYARLAQETGCEMFIAGCEMVMAQRREAEWRGLFRALRKVYDGPLSYNTDKYQEDRVAWWDCVDVISSSGYYPLGAWEEQLDRIEAVVRRFGKPFFFAEAGCMSTAGSAAVPNNWELDGPADPGEQAAWYEEMFAACARRPWVGGFALWDWPCRLCGEEEAPADRGYAFHAKPAEEVVRRYYKSMA